MAKELVDAFSAELKGLQRAEKKDINALSMIAEDNKQHAGSLVTAIEKHLMTVSFLGPCTHGNPTEAACSLSSSSQCPAPQKLPALYLLDSIVKNVKDPYVELFSRRLPEVSSRALRRALLGQGYLAYSNRLLPTGVWSSLGFYVAGQACHAV